jgi:TRAP-type C4-dicarboxylate transport system permease small subunit
VSRHAAPASGSDALDRIVGRISRATDLLAGAMLFLLCVVTVVDVVGRDIFRQPIKGADEFTVVFMAISVYAVYFTVTWRQDHVCVDLIDLAYPKSRFAIGVREVLIHLAAFAFMAAVTYRVFVVADRLHGYGEVTEYRRIPKGLLTYFFFAMCALTTLGLLLNTVRYIAGVGPLQRPAGAAASGATAPGGPSGG